MNIMINYSSKWWYKLITIILVLSLILYFSIGIAPKASAIVVSSVIVGSVLAAMAATGIGLAVSGMTAEELTQWVSDKLNDWTTDIGGSIQDHIDNNLITVTANGILSIGSAAAQGITDFISWLKGEESLTDNQTVNVVSIPGVLLVDQSYYMPVATNRNTYYYSAKMTQNPYYTVFYVNSSNDIIMLIAARGYNLFQVAENNGSYVSPNYTGYTISSTTYSNNSTYNLVYYVYNTGKYGYVNDISGNTGVYQSLNEALSAINDAINSGSYGKSLDIETGVITIPTIDTKEKWYINVGADAGEDVDTVTDGVITDTLTNTLDVTGEVVEPAQEVVIVNEDAIAVNVDHHMIGFTNLPDFAHLNLNSIWHYVSDAVDFAHSWLAWFVSFLTAMPLLAIPLYMSFTLLVVLSFLRRFI